MTPELWRRLKPLFSAAIDKPSNERSAFIAQICADDSELRGHLLGLIAAHEHESSTVANVEISIKQLIDVALPVLHEGETVLGRFQVVRCLGSGGMGNVYEAMDLELSQKIALKTIRPEISRIPGILTRFKKEVQLARRLSGPNLCRIHELFVISGSTGDAQYAFITMELLDGPTLADQLRDSGHFSWREAQTIALDICTALTTIHQAGIIHRDLKTRNVMLATRAGIRCAVVMDFGLAREIFRSSTAHESGLTVPGAILGTPEYMAPEQFEGKDISPATDVYAFGVMLYELVTGKHPFAASTPLGAAALRGKRPQPASLLHKGLPRRWDHVISRCLEYDSADRYQSAKAAADALQGRSLFGETFTPQWFGSLAAGFVTILIVTSLLFLPALRERLQGIIFSSRVKHVAVLPFDVSGDPKMTVLADGLMDSLSGKLSSLDAANKSLWVVPASEIRRRKVSDPPTALKEFGVTIVVIGRFTRDNQTFHLNLALVDTKKTREIGFADIENQNGDLAALQDEAVTRLGRLMNVSIGKDVAREGEEGIGRPAYEDYITALGYLQRYDKPGYLDAALTSLNNAVKTAPRFALAFGRLAQAYILKYHIDGNPDLLQRARDSCRRAIALDDRLPSVYTSLASIHEITGEHELAIQEYQHAIDLDPRNVEAFTGMATSYKNAGRYREAEAAYVRAAELRPDDWNGYNYLGNFYERIGRHQDAIVQFRRALTLTPDNGFVYCNLGGAYLNSGDPKLLTAAEDAFHRSISLNPNYEAYADLGNLYGIEHRFADSATATKEALQLNDQDYDVWNNLTQAYEALGDENNARESREQAIKLAERAIRLNSQDSDAYATLATLFAKQHLRESAISSIHTALALAPKEQSVLSEVAAAYEILGDRKLAMRYLALAIQSGYPTQQLNADSNLQRIAEDPAFKIK
jgi:eukaryotic-like serine/threonine-protein kinase